MSIAALLALQDADPRAMALCLRMLMGLVGESRHPDKGALGALPAVVTAMLPWVGGELR